MKMLFRRLLPVRSRKRKPSVLNERIDTATQGVDRPEPAATLGLEALAVELKLVLLRTVSNLTDLQSLVHASPLYYGTYLTDRHSIIARVLLIDSRSLQHVLAIGRALDIRQDQAATKEDVLSFFKSFESIDAGPASELESVVTRQGPILAQIQRSVQFAIRDFCTSVLSRHPVTGELFQGDTTLP